MNTEIKKKGESHLIEVVLIISFIVALVILVSQFSKKSTETILSETETSENVREFCDGVDFFLMDAYCDQNLVYIRINNKKDTDFRDSFTLRVDTLEGEKEITTFLVNTELRAYEEKELKALRLVESGENVLFNKLSVIPKIQIDDRVMYCTNLIKTYNLEGRGCDE